MITLIKKHQEAILILLSLLFAGGLIASYLWGTSFLTGAFLSSVNSTNQSKPSVSFDIEAASKLDFRGVTP